MEKVKKTLRKMLLSYRSLPDKKQYIEFFTALLSVPVMLTVIVLNLNNLRGANKAPTPQPQKEVPIYITTKPDSASNKDTTSTTSQSNAPIPTSEVCTKGIGPITIDYPEEGTTVSDNPLTIDINYQQGNYCSVVWAYRINGGPYSDYDDKSIALYNPPNGKITLQVKVKSLVSSDEKTLTRTFTYTGTGSVPTPPDSQNTASSSAH
jgi:hypothetical protein